MTLLNQKSRRSAFWGAHLDTHTNKWNIFALVLQVYTVHMLHSGPFFLIICLSCCIHPALVPMIILKPCVAPSCSKVFGGVVQRSHTSPTPCCLRRHGTAHSFTHSFTVLNTATDCYWESSNNLNGQAMCAVCFSNRFGNICFLSFIMNRI